MKLLIPVILLLSCVSQSSFADTVCGQGTITKFEHIYNSQSFVRFSTTILNGDKNVYRYVHSTYMSEMWLENTTRWNDRMKLLQMAFTLQVPVSIVSKDDNCMGPDNEFDIMLMVE